MTVSLLVVVLFAFNVCCENGLIPCCQPAPAPVSETTRTRTAPSKEERRQKITARDSQRVETEKVAETTDAPTNESEDVNTAEM
mmetsp:Transcript_8790/g.20142  ORF Transcript_8790/g.20142 Transcript_8790/m.20142 type:complete len:84 (-) Transcript_8790:47-298(-)